MPSRARGSTRRGDTMSQRARYDDPRLVREPMAVVEGDQSQSVLALLTRMRASAFQGRQLGEAFETWKRMIEGPSLICLGYAASLSSAGLWPLVTWLLDRGYVDVLRSEEHTSELQSRLHLVCRLLLEKKK